MMRLLVPFAAAALVLSGCSGAKSGSDQDVPVVKTGVFVDAAVEGLRYESRDVTGAVRYSGQTDRSGTFRYQEGDVVELSIGGIKLPAVPPKPTLTPLDVFSTMAVSDPRVTNLARLLQTIDSDGTPTNGITVAPAAHTAAAGLTSVDFSTPSFDTAVDGLVKNSGSPTTALRDASSAVDHLNQTLSTVAASLPGIPGRLHRDWVKGKTLYAVWFGDGEDQNGSPLTNVPVVVKVQVGDSVVTATGLVNSSGTATDAYDVSEYGLFYTDGDATEGNAIVCGSTADYVKTHYFVGGAYDNTDLWFFDETKARNFAATLTATIPRCGTALTFAMPATVSTRVLPTVTVAVDGSLANWNTISPVLLDPRGDQRSGSSTSTDLIALYAGQSSTAFTLALVTDGPIAFPHTASAGSSHYEIGIHAYSDENCANNLVPNSSYLIVNRFSMPGGAVAGGLDDYISQPPRSQQPISIQYSGSVFEVSFSKSMLPAGMRSFRFNPYIQSFDASMTSTMHDNGGGLSACYKF